MENGHAETIHHLHGPPLDCSLRFWVSKQVVTGGYTCRTSRRRKDCCFLLRCASGGHLVPGQKRGREKGDRLLEDGQDAGTSAPRHLMQRCRGAGRARVNGRKRSISSPGPYRERPYDRWVSDTNEEGGQSHRLRGGGMKMRKECQNTIIVLHLYVLSLPLTIFSLKRLRLVINSLDFAN